MADSGTPILSLLPTVTLLDTDVLPLARPSGTTAAGANLGISGATLKRLAPTGNSAPGSDKRVRFQTAAQLAAAPDGGDSLDGLNPATLVLGGLAWVEFHASLGYGITLRLLYDGATRTPAGSGLTAFRTGDLVAGDTVPVRWALASGPQVGVPAYPQKPAGYVFALNELVRAYVSDVPSEQFFSAKAATALPAPTVSTGDANWLPVSASSLPAAVAPLYGSTGTATNGPMTQAATSAALVLKADLVNGTLALAQRPLASAAEVGTVRIGRGLYISPAALLENNMPDFANEILLDNSRNIANIIYFGPILVFVTANDNAYTLADFSVQPVAPFIGRLQAVRATANVSFGTGAMPGSTQSLINGSSAAFQMLAGEWIIFRRTAIGYDVIMRGTTATPAAASPPATVTVAGIVKIGANITVAADGTISVAAPGATGGVFRGTFAAVAYALYDCILIPVGQPNAGLFAYATAAFTATATYSAANWTLDPGQSTNDYTAASVARLGVGVALLTTATNVSAAINEVRNTLPGTAEQAAAYTLALSDAGNVVPVNSATAVAVTIPPNSATAFPLGSIINLSQVGAGQILVTAGTGVTLRQADAQLKSAKQWAEISLRKRAADEWVLTGYTAA